MGDAGNLNKAAERLNVTQSMVIRDYSYRDKDNYAEIPAAWIGPSGDVSRSPAGTGALAVAAYCVEMGELAIGRSLNVVTPYGNKLRGQINDASANVEGAIRIFAAINHFQ